MVDIHRIIKKYKALHVQVRASVWFLVCSFLQKGVSMLTTPIFTRLLSTSEYGQYGAFNSWFGILYIVITLSISTGVYTQGLVKFSEDRDIFSSSLQGLTTILIILWTVIYFLFHDFWNDLLNLTTVQMMAMLVMAWTSAVFNFWANEQRVTYFYRNLVVVTLLVSIAKPVLGVFLVRHAEDKVTARILGLMLVELVGYSWMYVVQVKRGKKFFSKEFWKYALLFNIPLVPHYLSQTVLNSADRIMIKNMVGDSEAGIYNLAYSLSSVMTLFNTALSQTISPWMYQKIKEKKGKDIAPIAYVTLMIVAVANLVLMLLAPEAVKIFAPKSYYDAIWVIPPVAMSVFFMYCYDLFAKYEFYYEKTKFIMIASVVGAIVNVLLNAVFINTYGYIAAGYTTLICYVLYAAGHYLFMRKICGTYCNEECPFELKNLVLIAMPFMLSGFICLVLYRQPLIRYAVMGMVLLIGVIKRKTVFNLIYRLFRLKKKK